MTIISSLFNFIAEKIGTTSMGTTATTLTGAISELKGLITGLTNHTSEQYGTPTVQTSSISSTASETSVVKASGICVCRLRFTVNNACSADTTLFKMPTGFVPSRMHRYTFESWSVPIAPSRFTLYSDGYLRNSDALSAGAAFIVTFVFAI